MSSKELIKLSLLLKFNNLCKTSTNATVRRFSTESQLDMNIMVLRIVKELVLKQNDLIEKKISINLNLYYPKIETDLNKVDFGNTYVGQISKVQIVLKNRCRKLRITQ